MRAILTYHSIDESASVISTSPALFRKQVDALVSRGVEVLPLESICDARPEAWAVALTFDDGFANFGTYAWPVLRERGLPATLFLVSGQVGLTNSWEHGSHAEIPELPLLGWDDLGRLAEEGLSLGSHSASHADLSRGSPACLHEEIVGSAVEIHARTGVMPKTFAYPYGRWCGEAEIEVSRTYEKACTTDLCPIRGEEHPHRLPRIDTHYFRSPALLMSWGSRRLRYRVGLRRQLRRLRTSLNRGA